MSAAYGRPPLLRMITPPSKLAVSVSDARDHLSVDFLDDDNMIATYIQAAQNALGLSIGRALVPTSYALDLWSWCSSGLVLPMPPLQQVTAIKVRGSDGLLTALDPSNYSVSISSEGRGVVNLIGTYALTTVWYPQTAASIEFTAGYDVLPGGLRAAILLTVGTLYENRSSVAAVQTFKVPGGVDALLAPFIDPVV
jgi:uncharacterized phiE125 gp8 family phage protein